MGFKNVQILSISNFSTIINNLGIIFFSLISHQKLLKLLNIRFRLFFYCVNLLQLKFFFFNKILCMDFFFFLFWYIHNEYCCFHYSRLLFWKKKKEENPIKIVGFFSPPLLASSQSKNSTVNLIKVMFCIDSTTTKKCDRKRINFFFRDYEIVFLYKIRKK